MKKTYIILLAIPLVIGCSENKPEKPNPGTPDFITEEKIKTHLQNREDSSKWDRELFANDLAYLNESHSLAFTSGVFPVPNYDLIGKGSFKGVGNSSFPGGPGIQLDVAGKTVLSNSFFVNSSPVNAAYTRGMKDEIFFQILVLTDFVDTVNYSHLSSEIISRNHPDYIGQGFFKTQNNRIDYMAFLASNRNSYAIVNMRLFDLTLGKTILIAPQKDKSFRSMQIKSPKLSSKTSGDYLKQLVKRKDIVAFFAQHETI